MRLASMSLLKDHYSKKVDNQKRKNRISRLIWKVESCLVI